MLRKNCANKLGFAETGTNKKNTFTGYKKIRSYNKFSHTVMKIAHDITRL